MSGETRYPDGTIDQPWWRYDGDVKAWHKEQDKILMSAMLRALEHPDTLTVNILRLWPREQIVNFAKHLLGEHCQLCKAHEDPKPTPVTYGEIWEVPEFEECPECHKMSVKCASGGGVECITPGCGYWFCY
jgi:hypothetical protein